MRCIRSTFSRIKNSFKLLILTLSLLLTGNLVWAKGATGPLPENTIENPLALTLLIIIGVLAFIIILLAWVVNGAADVFLTRIRKNSTGAGGTITLMLLFLSNALFAQETATGVSNMSGDLEAGIFYLLIGVIAMELIAILYLLYNLQLLIKAELPKSTATQENSIPAIAKESWWSKLNKFKPVEEEADIDLGHDYDGIRELDNRLPPWWLYGFYLWRFHVSHTGPSSEEEFKQEMAIAAIQKEEYLKKAANNIDETSVVLLDAGGIAAGEALYILNCSACHGKSGEGSVGPNLTDDYWLHGGSINDIFKTIKYGVPEKGMRAWKEDFSPIKMAQLSSYIKSIHGSNPPNAKEKQGGLYKEKAMPADSSAISSADSIVITKLEQ